MQTRTKQGGSGYSEDDTKRMLRAAGVDDGSEEEAPNAEDVDFTAADPNDELDEPDDAEELEDADEEQRSARSRRDDRSRRSRQQPSRNSARSAEPYLGEQAIDSELQTMGVNTQPASSAWDERSRPSRKRPTPAPDDSLQQVLSQHRHTTKKKAGSSRSIDESKPHEVEKISHVFRDADGYERFCLKWRGYSYRRVTYVSEDEALELCKPKVSALRNKESRGEDVRTPFPEQYLKVDKVLAKRWSDKYLVQWQGLTPSEATWEDESTLMANEEDRAAIERHDQCEKLDTLNHKDLDATHVKPPPFRNGMNLRDYQVTSFEWMVSNLKRGQNVVLGDEMGLGKTCQCLAVLDFVRRTDLLYKAPFLLIAPLTTLQNWKREIQTWTEMNVVVFSGTAEDKEILKRYDMFRKSTTNMKFNILLTSYEHARKDANYLCTIPWSVMVVDEAHRLKGENSKITQAIKMYQSQWKLLMTGTPIQNNMRELFILLNLLHPEEHPSWDDFKGKFCNADGTLNPEMVTDLHEMLRPVLLRRMKEDVETIPCKEEVVVWVDLTYEQRRWYKAMMEDKVGYLVQGKGRDAPTLRNLCMELRKVCNHPLLCDGVESEIQERRQTEGKDTYSHIDLLTRTSGKLAMLDKLLDKLKKDGQKVLIFSQFRMVLDLLEDFMLLRQYEYERLDGSSKHSSRQDAIDRFNTSGQGFTFLLTTRAGGQGITLTAATTAVLFDSDWNPQSDLQAMARCHRIGQTEEVRVYRLVTRDTYEQKLFETSSCKYGLDEAVLGGNTTQLSNNEASVERIKSLLRHGVHGIVSKAEDGSESKQLEAGIDQILETEAEHRAIDSKANNTFSQAKFSINPNEKKEADVDNEALNKLFNRMQEQHQKKKKKESDKNGPAAKKAMKSLTTTDDVEDDLQNNEDVSANFEGDQDDDSGSDEDPFQRGRRRAGHPGHDGTRRWSKPDVLRLRDALVWYGMHSEEPIKQVLPKRDGDTVFEAAKALLTIIRRLDTSSEASAYKIKREEDPEAIDASRQAKRDRQRLEEVALSRAREYARNCENVTVEARAAMCDVQVLRELQRMAAKDADRLDQNKLLNDMMQEDGQAREELKKAVKSASRPSAGSRRGQSQWLSRIGVTEEVDILRGVWKYGFASHGTGSAQKLEEQIKQVFEDPELRLKRKGLWLQGKFTNTRKGETDAAVPSSEYKRVVQHLLSALTRRELVDSAKRTTKRKRTEQNKEEGEEKEQQGKENGKGDEETKNGDQKARGSSDSIEEMSEMKPSASNTKAMRQASLEASLTRRSPRRTKQCSVS